MSVIADIDHEGGTTGEYSSVTGSISVSAGAALAGTAYGMSSAISTSQTNCGNILGLNNTSGKLRFRFYIDPNSFTKVAGRFGIFYVYNGNYGDYLLALRIEYKSASDYYLRLDLYKDDGNPGTSRYATMSDALHYVEIYMQKSTGDNGSAAWWLDGSAQTSVTGIDNDTRWSKVDTIRLGTSVVDYADSGDSGTIYFDQLVVNDDGSAIGPYNVSLTVANATCAVTSEAPALTVNADLTVAAATCAVTSENVVIVYHEIASNISLTVQDATCAVTCEAPALTAHAVLTVAAATCAVSSEAPALTVHAALAVANATCAVTAGVLTSGSAFHGLLALTSSVGVGEFILTVHATLAVANATCAVTVDNVVVAPSRIALTVANATCAVTSEAPALTAHAALVVAAATCALTAEAPGLTAHAVLVVAAATCAVISDIPGLTGHAVLAIADAVCAVTADNVTIQASRIMLAAAAATCSVTSEAPALTAHAALAVADATCAVSADSPELTISTEPLETLIDDFNDNSIDPAKWVVTESNYTVAETNQRIEIATSLAAGYGWLTSLNLYDLRDSQRFVRVVDAGDPAVFGLGVELNVIDYDTGILLYFQMANYNNVLWFGYVGGFPSFVTYDPSVHKYFRIRETWGVLFWEYSTNSIDWVILYDCGTTDTGAVFDKVYDRLSAATGGTNATTTTVIFDNFNVTNNSMAVANAACAVTSDNVTIQASRIMLAVADTICAVTAENVVINYVVHTVLVIEDATSLTAVDAPGLTGHNYLSVMDASAVVTSEAPGLTGHGYLTVADATCLTAAETMALLIRAYLIVATATCDVSAESVTIRLSKPTPAWRIDIPPAESRTNLEPAESRMNIEPAESRVDVPESD